MQRIKCGHCSTFSHAVYHPTKQDVFNCARNRMHAANVKQEVRASVVQSRPNEWSLKAPEQMVRNIRTGRYAVRPDSLTAYTFLRVLRPNRGKRKGCLVIDTQHGDEFKLGIVFYPNGTFWINTMRGGMAALDQALILAAVDETTGARNYARELGRCSRCGKQLTDERSRWYGVGPECEKHWPDLFAEVDEEQGGPWYLGRVYLER